jgi:ketosteroid isomerase-like protein
MGATDTMEIFFEKLNSGDRQGAVALMDEQTEMRVHVRDGSRTLRGVAQVGGWFLRADEGLKMVPGQVREMGNTYEVDLIVIRPDVPSQHIDATFRVEAGKITAINFSPR